MSAEHAPRIVLAATLLLSSTGWLLGLEAGWFALIPWVLSIVFFGLPHGAADHIVWSSIRGENGRFAPVVVRYILVMVIYAALWWVYPPLAAFLFLGITVWHWGSADAARSFARAEAPPMSVSWVAASVSRGIVPILAPLAFYEDVVIAIVADWSPSLSAAELGAWVPETSIVLSVVLLSQIIWMMIMMNVGASPRTEGIETLLVTLLLVAVHPLIGVGVYFSFWHAWHHDRRLVSWYADAKNGMMNRSKRRDQVIIMVFTLAGMAAVLSLIPPGPSTLTIYLILISILTMPHMVVVWMMDRQDGNALRL